MANGCMAALTNDLAPVYDMLEDGRSDFDGFPSVASAPMVNHELSTSFVTSKYRSRNFVSEIRSAMHTWLLRLMRLQVEIDYSL